MTTADERTAAIETRRLQVAELSRAGLSERQIAERLGVSRTTVWTDKQVLKGLAR